MKILLIQPTTSHADGTPYKSKSRWMMGLTLPYLAGLTPKGIDVRLLDDRMEEIDYDAGYDLVGITTTITTSYRAYQIADHFRKRGVPVVMGGFHATLLPEECLEHCDAVVEGEAELSWPQLVDDFSQGKMKRRYRAEQYHDLKNLPAPRWDLLDRRKYLVPYLPLMTTRGCPFACSFCEVPLVYGTKYRHRPIGEVVEDVKRIPTRKIQIVDDNVASSHEYARELFKALIPLKVRWSCLWTMNTARDHELLDLAVKAGVYHVNIGIESISQGSLTTINKKQNKVQEYVEMLRELEKRGIFYSLNFMFGLDEDTKEIFQETMDFLKQLKAPMVFFNTPVPREGTAMRRELEKEGRVINPYVDRHLGMECLFAPRNMTTQEVLQGLWKTYRDFYSLPKIVKRFLWPPNAYTSQGLPSNLIFWWFVNRMKDPVDIY
ncbi:MAG TPA: radical SAM protein [Geomonas sp.]|nr:radical SAM protein [Geomonas sp.]